ncbi:Transcription activator of gluconeogenesis [Quillaja saponaria]|uniref:Transcription activator of gluconeogenesis n=1 Tax=Quillaja saponaria TaxID=32244 RepID=A0AAD7PI97_QUISA|nr:Transcription activator of gluconeogenesis [Quillaja saponaria]
MATNLLSIRPVGFRVCASTGQRQPDPSRGRSSSSHWWIPLFGLSSEPDYIDSNNKSSDNVAEIVKERKASKPQFAGCFTEEKARQLRMMTKESESFHDAMYHSAIASRLALDFKNRSDL